MTEYSSVPVVCIDRTNVTQTWPSLKLAVSTASFIAIDTELSGLGNRASLLANDIEERYASSCAVASSRAIISVGVSCFKLQFNEQKTKWNYVVQTYNILTLCEHEYVVEPESLKFLIQHGFDFNKQYSSGLLYSRLENDNEENEWSPRELFELLVTKKKPIVLHNGFIDLVFLYQNLYVNAPKKLMTFIADLQAMFPAGIFDTKYIAEYHVRLSASYLEYIYRKSEKLNGLAEVGNQVSIMFLDYASAPSYVEFRSCNISIVEDKPICNNFASFGWCEKSDNCLKSHDVGRIIELEDLKKQPRNQQRESDELVSCNDKNSKNESTQRKITKKQRKRKRKNKQAASTEYITKSTEKCGHRAGFDAYMTGFAFATYVATYGTFSSVEEFNANSLNMSELANRLYLARKDFPLTVIKSTFAKNSAEYLRKTKTLDKAPPFFYEFSFFVELPPIFRDYRYADTKVIKVYQAKSFFEEGKFATSIDILTHMEHPLFYPNEPQ